MSYRRRGRPVGALGASSAVRLSPSLLRMAKRPSRSVSGGEGMLLHGAQSGGGGRDEPQQVRLTAALDGGEAQVVRGRVAHVPVREIRARVILGDTARQNGEPTADSDESR